MESFVKRSDLDELQIVFQSVTDASSEREALELAAEAFRRVLYAVDSAHYCEPPKRVEVIRAVVAIREATQVIISVAGLYPQTTLMHINAAAMLIGYVGGYMPWPTPEIYSEIEDRARLLSFELSAAVLRQRIAARGDRYPRYLAELTARFASRSPGQMLN